MRSANSLPTLTPMTGILLGARRKVCGDDRYVALDLASDGQPFKAIAFEDDDVWLERLGLPLSTVSFSLLESPGGGDPVLLGMRPELGHPAFWHVPGSTCPIDGVLAAVQAHIDVMETNPLRAFLLSVFARREIHASFWTMPASIRHHHAFPGGLASHSLEVAADLASHRGLTLMERELGVAAGLLHDIGKVWGYDHQMELTSANRAMGHELLGLVRLEPDLVQLEQEWPDGAHTMRCLLSGQARMRSDGSLPHSLLQRIRACDQRSAERDTRSRGRRAHPAWIPSPCVKACNDLEF